MLKKVRVDNAGGTDLLPGQLVDKLVLDRENKKIKKLKSKEQATWEPLILGITKASLATESFLSAASFQETTKVLTDAAIEGKVDRLLGLKENVIIGKLIPAATGLKRYRQIQIRPSDKVPVSAYTRPATEEQLLAALEEIGDGGTGWRASASTSAASRRRPTATARRPATARSRPKRSPRSTRRSTRTPSNRSSWSDRSRKRAAGSAALFATQVRVRFEAIRDTHRPLRRGCSRSARAPRAHRCRFRRTRASAAFRRRSRCMREFGWPTPAYEAIFGKPGIVVGASSGAWPAKMRAAGRADRLLRSQSEEPHRHDREARRPVAPRRPREDVLRLRRRADGLRDAGDRAQRARRRESRDAVVGQQRAVPRRTRSRFVQQLAALGAHPVLLIASRPYTGGDAGLWWQQVAASAEIVREDYVPATATWKSGPVLGNRDLRDSYRQAIADLTSIGIPPSRLGLMISFASTKGFGGRSGLQPDEAWYEVAKWQSLAAQQVAAETGIASVWSWGWGQWTAGEQDPAKPYALCAWLWTRSPTLCDAPKAHRRGLRHVADDGTAQRRSSPGEQCVMGAKGEKVLSNDAIQRLQLVTGERDTAYSALYERVVDSGQGPGPGAGGARGGARRHRAGVRRQPQLRTWLRCGGRTRASTSRAASSATSCAARSSRRRSPRRTRPRPRSRRSTTPIPTCSCAW